MAMTDAAPPPGENEDLVLDLDEPEAEGEKTEKTEKVAKPPPVPGPSATAPAAPAAPQPGLDALKDQIENVRRERDQQQVLARRMQQERDQWAVYAQEAERRGVSALEVYADTKIQGIQDQMEALAAQQEAAMGDGDFKTTAQINLKIGRLGGELVAAERDKNIAVQQREHLARRGQQQPQRQQPQPQREQQLPSDPLERALIGRNEGVKAFLRKHPEMIRGDGSLKRAVIDAHERALDEGFAEGSEQYYGCIEKILEGNRAPAPTQATEETRHVPGYAAPASRAAVPTTGVRGDGTFVMTPKMRQLAADAGVTEKEWAANYVRLVREGRMTPIT